MKVILEDKKIFQPITLSLVLESYEEVEGLATLFNYCPVYDFLNTKGIDCSKIRDV